MCDKQTGDSEIRTAFKEPGDAEETQFTGELDATQTDAPDEGLSHSEVTQMLEILKGYQNDLDLPASRDTTSGSVLCHLSFLLEILLPKWTIKGPMTHVVQQQMPVLERSKTKFLKFLGRQFDIVFVGSFSDVCYIPNHIERHDGDEFNDAFLQGTRNAKYDVDILLMIKITPLSDSLIDDSQTYPCYCQLPMKTSKGDYLTPEMILQDLPMFEDMTRTGPAFALVGEEGFSIDLVPTLPVRSWPQKAIEWIGRHRFAGWPTTQMIVDIVQAGCHVVAKSHPHSKKPDLEWRYSFVMAEKKLIRSLSIVQRQAFILCKMLIKELLGSEMAFSSYCIKTTLFWTVEKIPGEVWSNVHTGLATGVLAIIDHLISFLTEHNVPMYFIPENNIIVHESAVSIRRNIQKLVLFRQQPISVIKDFDRRNIVIFVHSPKLTDVFPDVLSAVTTTEKTTLKQCLHMQSKELQFYLIYRLNLNSVTSGLGTWEQVCELSKSLNSYPPNLKSSIPCLVEFRNVLEKDVIPLAPSEVLGRDQNWCEAYRLGCLATVMSLVYLKYTSENSARDADTIAETFELALTYQLTSPIIHVYYALFLIHQNKLTKALSVLELATVAFDKSKDMIFGDYFWIVPDSLDKTLQFLLRVSPKTPTFPSHIMVDYLLIAIYREVDRDKLPKQLKTFEEDWDELPMNILKGYSCMVLGYAYLSVMDMDNGSNFIRKACEICQAHNTKATMDAVTQVQEYLKCTQRK